MNIGRSLRVRENENEKTLTVGYGVRIVSMCKLFSWGRRKTLISPLKGRKNLNRRLVANNEGLYYSRGMWFI
jgi:hypothetical protein